MKNIAKHITRWLLSAARVWVREFRLVFSDAGVMLFFFILPTAYPLVYTFIYNPEVVRDIPVAVVDEARTSMSRELARHADATDAIKIIGYASSLSEARRWHAEKACYGILVIPEDYEKKIGRGEQSAVVFYSDMSLLLRYREFLSAMTDLSIATGAEIRQEMATESGMPVDSRSVILGNSAQGFASFAIPGILILILQQSLILGITMLGGAEKERRRRNNGYDPLAIDAPATAALVGKSLCYFTIYIPLAIYILHYVPLFFNLPHMGSAADYLLFIVPLLFASIFMGMAVRVFVSERESSMLVIVFSSVAFLFLSGLTWPRYAMSAFWQWIGGCVPATWGVEGFIRINNNGASLEQAGNAYIMLWILTAIYFILAATLLHYQEKKRQSNINNS